MNVLKSSAFWSALLAGSIILSGCSEKASDDKGAAAQSITLSGKAVDGYLRDSIVCLDLNDDGYCQIGDEPAATTEADGSFTLTATVEQQAHENYATADLIVFDGWDSDTQMRFLNKLKAPYEAGTTSFNITPITTMVAAVKNEGGDIAAAKTKVAKMLKITETELSKDPVSEAKSGNSKVLSAALQVQKTVEVLVKAAKSSTSSSEEKTLTENMFKALAIGLADANDDDLNSSDISDNIGAVLDKATANTTAAAAMGAKAVAIKEAAKIMAKNVESVMGTSGTNLSADEIMAKALTIQSTKESFDTEISTVVAALEADPTATWNPNVIKTDAHTVYTVSSTGIDAALIGNMLKEAGIKDANSTVIDAIKNAGFTAATATLSDLNSTLNTAAITNPDLNATKAAVEIKLQEEIISKEQIAQAVAIVATVESILATDKTATVADAKKMANELRETAYTFFNEDPATGELNASSAMGIHSKAIEKRIVPAVEKFESDLNITMNAVGDMAEAFGNAIDTDFNASITALGDRLEAIDIAKEASLAASGAEKTTSFGDKVTFKRTVVTGTSGSITQVVTITNAAAEKKADVKFTTVEYGTVGADGYITDDPKTGIVVTSANTTNYIKDAGYDLTINSIKIDSRDGKAKSTFDMSGTVTGINSAKMTLTKLTASVYANENIDGAVGGVENIEFTFNGTITAGGKTLTGKLVLSESAPANNMISGKFSGSSTEPVVEGKITANVNLDEFKAVMDDESKSSYKWIDIATDADGKNYFVINRETSNESYGGTWGSSENNNTTKYFLHNGSAVTCESNIIENHYEDTVAVKRTCNKADYKISQMRDDSIVEVTLNDGSKGYFDGRDYMSGNYRFHSNTDGFDLGFANSVVTKYSWGSSKTVTISSISFRKAKLFENINSSLAMDANVTHGSVKIAAKASMVRDAAGKKTTFSAKDIIITNGTSYLKANTLLSATIPDDKYGDYNNINSYTLSGTSTYSYDEWEAKRYGSHGGDEIPTSMTISGLVLKVVDEYSSPLTATAELSFTSSNETTFTGKFNGKYSYLGTSFTGLIELNAIAKDISYVATDTYYLCNGYMYDHNVSEYNPSMTCEAKTHSYTEKEKFPVGTAKIRGVVAPGSGFRPFAVELTGTTTDTDLTATMFFSRTRDNGSKYYLAAKAVATGMNTQNEGTFTLTMGDSNGVRAKATGPKNSELTSIIFKDKNGVSLATYSQAVNDWELVYADGTSESGM